MLPDPDSKMRNASSFDGTNEFMNSLRTKFAFTELFPPIFIDSSGKNNAASLNNSGFSLYL